MRTNKRQVSIVTALSAIALASVWVPTAHADEPAPARPKVATGDALAWALNDNGPLGTVLTNIKAIVAGDRHAAVFSIRPYSDPDLAAEVAEDARIYLHTPANRPTQQWQLTVLGGGEYAFVNGNGQCLDVDGQRTERDVLIIANGCDDTAQSQRWKLDPNSPTSIVNSNSDLCLDPRGGIRPDAILIQWTCDSNNPNQTWRLFSTS